MNIAWCANCGKEFDPGFPLDGPDDAVFCRQDCAVIYEREHWQHEENEDD